MNGTLNRLEQLDARFERLRLDLQDTQRKLTQALQQIRETGARFTPSGGVGSATVFQIPAADAIVITGGGSATANVYVLQGGTVTLFASSATIYNGMQSATVTAKTIILGSNGDGSFTCITQSC